MSKKLEMGHKIKWYRKIQTQLILGNAVLFSVFVVVMNMAVYIALDSINEIATFADVEKSFILNMND